MMNGDIPRSSSQPGTLEETLQQMNILIQENRDLKGKSRWLEVQSVGAGKTQTAIKLLKGLYFK